LTVIKKICLIGMAGLVLLVFGAQSTLPSWNRWSRSERKSSRRRSRSS